MELRDLVVSLELARELKEHGYPQDTLFYWWENKYDRTTEKYGGGYIYSHHVRPHNDKGGGYLSDQVGERELCAAPTAGELGEALKHVPWEFPAYKLNSSEWETELRHDEWISGDTEVNARAKMWLYLKKNNLLGGTNA